MPSFRLLFVVDFWFMLLLFESLLQNVAVKHYYCSNCTCNLFVNRRILYSYVFYVWTSCCVHSYRYYITFRITLNDLRAYSVSNEM